MARHKCCFTIGLFLALVTRVWAIPIGVHNGANPTFDSVGYNVYTEATLPTQLTWPVLANPGSAGIKIACLDCVGTDSPLVLPSTLQTPTMCTWTGPGGQWVCGAVSALQPTMFGASGRPTVATVASASGATIATTSIHDYLAGETVDVWGAGAVSTVQAPTVTDTAATTCPGGANSINYKVAAVDTHGGVSPATAITAGGLAGTASGLTAVNCAVLSMKSSGGTTPYAYLIWRDTTGSGNWVLVAYTTGGGGTPAATYTSSYRDSGQYTLSSAVTPFPLTPTSTNTNDFFETTVASVPDTSTIVLAATPTNVPVSGAPIYRNATGAFTSMLAVAGATDFLIPPGTFMLSAGVVLPDNGVLRGVGKSSVVWRAPWFAGVSNDGLIDAALNGHSATFEQFTIEDSPVAGSPAFNASITGYEIWGNSSAKVKVDSMLFRDIDSKPISDLTAVGPWWVTNNIGVNLYWRGFSDIIFAANAASPTIRLHMVNNSIQHLHGDDAFDSGPVDGYEYVGNSILIDDPLTKCATAGVGNVGIAADGINGNISGNTMDIKCGVGVYVDSGFNTGGTTTAQVNVDGNTILERNSGTATGAPINVSGPNTEQIHIGNNLITNVNPGSAGILMSSAGCSNITVEGNSIINASGTLGAGRITDTCDNTRITDNYAEAILLTSSNQVIGGSNGNGAEISGNTLYGYTDSTGTVYSLGITQATNAMSDVVAMNNKIVAPTASGSQHAIGLIGTITNIVVKDNSILNNTPGTSFAYSVGVGLTNAYVRHITPIVRSMTSNGTQQYYDNGIRFTGTGGLQEAMLDPNLLKPGQEFFVLNDTSGNVDLVPSGSSTINGVNANYTLATTVHVTVYANGNDWTIK